MKTKKPMNPAMERLIVSLAVLATSMAAQSQSWTNYYGGPVNGDDRPNAAAISSSTGNVIVTGGTVGNDWQAHGATIMYSSAGQPLWTNEFRRPGAIEDNPVSVVLDHSGNVVVRGHTVSPMGDTDFATVKYSATGVPVWTNYYGHVENGHDATGWQTCVAVDLQDNVLVAGDSQGIARDWYSSSLAIIKYSRTGEPLWTNRFNTLPNGVHALYGLAVDSSGNAIAVGQAYDNRDLREAGYVIKYSSTGLPIWTNYLSHVRPQAVALDAADNVVVACLAPKEVGPFEPVDDILTIKYSPAGTVLWSNLIQHREGAPHAGLITMILDSSANAFVSAESTGLAKLSATGRLEWRNSSAGALGVDGAGNVFVMPVTVAANSLTETIKYSSTGVPLRTNLFAGTFSGALSVDTDGNVLLAGSTWTGVDYNWVAVKYAAEVTPTMLNIQRLADKVVLSWTDTAFALQFAPAISGTFTNLPSATSPYTNTTSGGQQFFRLVK
jgi:hypothetical protein